MPGMFKSPNKAEDNILSDLGPLYHNYSFFGVNNVQLPGGYELDQQAKAPTMDRLYCLCYCWIENTCIRHAFLYAELFCADGFYAMVASRLGCNRSIGIDNDRDKHFEHANLDSRTTESSWRRI